MTDYVLEQDKEWTIELACITHLNNCISYANFLKQPLTLGMFIPTDENGVLYESYLTYDGNNNTICEPYEGLFEIDVNSKCKGWKYLDSERTRYYDSVSYEIAKEKFQQAKDRVIFEGFSERIFETIKDNRIQYIGCDKFEYCYRDVGSNIWIVSNNKLKTIEDLVKYNLTITETAVKKYRL